MKKRANKVRDMDKSKCSKSAKVSYKGKSSKTGFSDLDNPKSETSRETQELTSLTLIDEWNDDLSSVG